MRDNEDIQDIPSIVPEQDDIAQYSSKKRQSDTARPASYGEIIKVSTWPVRIMLALLTVAIGAGAAVAYQVNQDNLAAMEQANRRIEELEGRLALVGDSAEETTANVIERLDFNFSEIDKLWAARNATNQDVNELTGKLALANDKIGGNAEATDALGQLIARNGSQIQEGLVGVNRLQGEVDRLGEQIVTLNSAIQSMQDVAQDMANIRASLNNGDSTLLGLQDRMENVEEAVESIDAYRLQVNQALIRLQDTIESVSSEAGQ
ncbi:MAG: hypothetical protein R3332_14135 [Pseudohongiellaceae bacterium]|nr:hypothetical protein [Pseudohongiellaceae bacterium]